MVAVLSRFFIDILPISYMLYCHHSTYKNQIDYNEQLDLGSVLGSRDSNKSCSGILYLPITPDSIDSPSEEDADDRIQSVLHKQTQSQSSSLDVKKMLVDKRQSLTQKRNDPARSEPNSLD